MINGHRDLQVWQRGMDLAAECYRVSAGFPQSEFSGITRQLRRAAVSVPANIAEGRGRRTTREFMRYLNIAYGSLMELQTHVVLASRLGFSTDADAAALLRNSEELGRMINGLRQSLQRRSRAAVARDGNPLRKGSSPRYRADAAPPES